MWNMCKTDWILAFVWKKLNAPAGPEQTLKTISCSWPGDWCTSNTYTWQTTSSVPNNMNYLSWMVEPWLKWKSLWQGWAHFYCGTAIQSKLSDCLHPLTTGPNLLLLPKPPLKSQTDVFQEKSSIIRVEHCWECGNMIHDMTMGLQFKNYLA